MTETAEAMALILATRAVLAVAFVGAGLLVRRALGFRLGGADSFFDAFWTGWAATVVVLQLWHLALPVDGRAALLPGTAAVLGWLAAARELRQAAPALFRAARSKAALVAAAVFVVGAVVLAGHALDPPSYDTGLYHLSAVRWAKTYAIVPGLGNLHGRLAYNNSNFLYAALLDVGPWDGRGRHLANGLLLLALLAQSAVNLPRAFRAGDPLRAYHIFAAALLCPVFVEASQWSASSYNPDLPAFVLGAVMTLRLLRLLLAVELPLPRPGQAEGLFLVGLLAAVGTTVKLSFAVLGATSLLVAAAVVYRGPAPRRGGVVTLAAVALALLPWLARGVILSGYPAYPSTFGAVPVEWRMPRALVEDEKNWIVAWARQPNRPPQDVLGNWDWVRPWAGRAARDYGRFVAPLALLIPAAVLVLLARGTGPRRRWLCLVPACAAAPFWFFTAPATRFAGATFWILGAGSLALALGEGLRRRAMAALSGAALLTLCLGYPLVALGGAAIDLSRSEGLSRTPRPPLEPRTTRSGLVVYVPAGEDDRTFDAPLPATTRNRFLPGLRLRRAGDLSSGFVLDGDGEGPPTTRSSGATRGAGPTPSRTRRSSRRGRRAGW